MKKGKCRKSILLIAVNLLVCTAGYSQDLTGYWQGEFNSDMVPRLGRRTFFLNMVLIHDGKKIQGRFGTAQMATPDKIDAVWEVSGHIGKHDSLPSRLIRGKILLDLLPDGIAAVFWGFDDIHYLKNDTAEFLYGTWIPMGGSPRNDGAGGVFWVKKLSVDQLIKKIPIIDSSALSQFNRTLSGPDSLYTEFVSDTPILAAKELFIKKHDSVSILREMTKRKNIQQGDVVVHTKNISLQLYDNGIVDEDSVSVFFNDKMLLSHQRISETPISLNIELDEHNPTNELILFAENLGRIPPNTALIIVTAGDQRFELFSKTDMNENAVLVFRYQPK